MIQHSSVKSVKVTMTARKAMIAKTKNAYGEVSLYSYFTYIHEKYVIIYHHILKRLVNIVFTISTPKYNFA